MARSITIELPWPPSTNEFYNHFVPKHAKRSCVFISEEGRAFYRNVGVLLLEQRPPKMNGRLAVAISLYPPAGRTSDVDNRNKPILDSLKRRKRDAKQYPGAWVFAEDDSQVKHLETDVFPASGAGKAVVTITELPGEFQERMFAAAEDAYALPRAER